MIPRRWPLHPRPVLGESLSSWLGRTAVRYGMTAAELLDHDLGYPGLSAADLDVDPPAALLDALATRTGFLVEEVRALSLVSWVPLLLDGRGPVPGSFQSYVGEWSVLLSPTAHAPCDPAGWRPWLRPGPPPQVPACRVCLGAGVEPFVRLPWQLPLMASCPIHGLMLEPAVIIPGVRVGWDRDAGEAASAAIHRMDTRTWDALTSGGVDLPRRRVHAAVWFRLLRTLLDELNRPLGQVRSARGLLVAVWERAGAGLRRPGPVEAVRGVGGAGATHVPPGGRDRDGDDRGRRDPTAGGPGGVVPPGTDRRGRPPVPVAAPVRPRGRVLGISFQRMSSIGQ